MQAYSLLQTILYQYLLGWGMVLRWIGTVAGRVDLQGFAEMTPLQKGGSCLLEPQRGYGYECIKKADTFVYNASFFLHRNKQNAKIYLSSSKTVEMRSMFDYTMNSW